MSVPGWVAPGAALSVLGRDVPWLLAQQAERYPDKPFLVWQPFDGEAERWTYREFRRDCLSVAAGLAARGVGAGDKVLLHMNNCPEFLLVWFACAHLGAVVVTNNTRSVRRDLVYFAELTEPRCAITSHDYADLLAGAMPEVDLVTNVDELMTHGQYEGRRPIEEFADLAIQFTSGTTSRPKAVLWTHANALWASQLTSSVLHLRHDDVALVVLPLFHTNAQSYSLMSTLWMGGTIVLQPRFSASRFWDTSVEHGATWCSLVRFCVRALLSRAAPREHSYRFWAPAARMPEVEERLGIHTFGWWGMTETVAHPIVGSLEHPGPAMSIGRPSPAYEIAIRDENGAPTTPGERGALHVRGVRGLTMFKEYYGDPERTAASFDDEGWFVTGDLVLIREDGNLVFSDRAKDMIRVGSENVAASEIEAVVMESGLAAECAVVGRSDPDLDEVPVAFAVPLDPADPGVDQKILDFCVDNLAAFKVPRAVHLIPQLPRATLEKVAKDELRRRLADVQGSG